MTYQIWGQYLQTEPEVIDEADSLEEANYLLAEYQLAFGEGWRLWIPERRNPRAERYCQCHRNPKVVEKPGSSGSGPRYCKICNQVTREGKDYCTDCIDKSPYAKSLLERLSQMEKEDELAEQSLTRTSAKQLETSENLKEIVMILRQHGPRTMARLARDLNKNVKIVKNYVEILKRQGVVEVVKKSRSVMVKLINPN